MGTTGSQVFALAGDRGLPAVAGGLRIYRYYYVTTVNSAGPSAPSNTAGPVTAK